MFKKNNTYRFFRTVIVILFGSAIICSCQKKETTSNEPETVVIDEEDEEIPPIEATYKLPNISLTNWKVTLPVALNGKLVEVTPPEIIEYAKNEQLLPYMYNDSIEGALVFYTFPESSTPNSSYSRTELREQMRPGQNSTNWTFNEGGRMKGTLAVPNISKDDGSKYHRTIVMQIHGRLTNEQRDLIGENDNNAPPVLKIYWQDGKIRVKTKELKNLNDSYPAILYTDAWQDDEGYTFDTPVNQDKFTLEVIASDGRLEVILNETDAVVYDSEHMIKWGVFENYFKAGNYLQSNDVGASSVVKYYELEVVH